MLNYRIWNDVTKQPGRGVSVGHISQLPAVSTGETWVLLVGDLSTTTLRAGQDGRPIETLIEFPVAAALLFARTAALDAAKAYRDARQGAGYSSAIGRVDTDFERSLPLINNMASSAAGSIAAKTAFPLKKWTLADGSQVDLTPTKGVAVGAGVNTMLDACQQAYVATKAQIGAATSVEALAAIDITAGYPA